MQNLVKIIKQKYAHFKNRKRHRVLQVSTAGQWYLVLTIALGVVALSSGNNVIYILESILLGALILSGVVSEKFITSIDVSVQFMQAQVGHECWDCVMVHNKSYKPVYGIEVSEWCDDGVNKIAYFVKVDGNSTQKVWVKRTFEKRGYTKIHGYWVSTRYPFGFARKSKPISQPVNRLIWPKALPGFQNEHATHSQRQGIHFEYVDGEIRPYDFQDDARAIVATASVRGCGPMVKPITRVSPLENLSINQYQSSDLEFELQVQKITYAVQSSHQFALSIYKGKSIVKKITSKNLALKELSLIEREVPDVV